MISRLILLILRFIIFAHWLGLIFFQFVEYEYFGDEYHLEPACNALISGLPNVVNNCKYVISLMEGTYLIPGGYLEGTTLIKHFSGDSNDYFLLFFIYFVGQIIVAYVFGGVTDLIKNLNQAANIYREKLDAIKNFMLFYSFDPIVVEDVKVYFEYLWQKKRNHIYENNLLEHISENLMVKIREKVSPHQRYFFKDFYGLSKNKESKLISTLIMNMKEYIAFPFERIYTQGQLIKGLFILTDGTAFFTDGVNDEDQNEGGEELDEEYGGKNRNDYNHKVSVNRKELIEKMTFNEKYFIVETPEINNNFNILNNNKSNHIYENQTIFPLDSIFLKTGRGIDTCFVEDFTDFFIIDLKFFDSKLIINFPLEMQKLKEKSFKQAMLKVGENQRMQKLVFRHSARSINSYYQEEYDLGNIWIDIKYKIPTIINQSDINDNENEHFFGHSIGLMEFGFKNSFN